MISNPHGVFVWRMLWKDLINYVTSSIALPKSKFTWEDYAWNCGEISPFAVFFLCFKDTEKYFHVVNVYTSLAFADQLWLLTNYHDLSTCMNESTFLIHFSQTIDLNWLNLSFIFFSCKFLDWGPWSLTHNPSAYGNKHYARRTRILRTMVRYTYCILCLFHSSNIYIYIRQ